MVLRKSVPDAKHEGNETVDGVLLHARRVADLQLFLGGRVAFDESLWRRVSAESDFCIFEWW